MLALCGRSGYTDAEFERYFRRVYQHFGSPSGYEVLDDAHTLHVRAEFGKVDAATYRTLKEASTEKLPVNVFAGHFFHTLGAEKGAQTRRTLSSSDQISAPLY